MNFHVITLFPELFSGFKNSGLMGRALENSFVSLNPVQFRDFAINNQGQVDDSPFGGGGGMVARIESCVSAVEKLKAQNPNSLVIAFTPRGKPLSQIFAKKIAENKDSCSDLILFCGRYEGADERFYQGWVDHEISVGDSIYMGGEVPAMAFMESVSRLIPGVLGNEKSIQEESFEIGGLEYPQYTKPREFRGLKVPDVLLSGNHAEIAEWRKQKSILDTSLRRPDLLQNADLENLKNDNPKLPPVYLSLIHYPVVDKNDKLVTSSITNLDVHDIARSVKTFDLNGFFVVHPSKVLRALIQKVCDHWSHGVGLEYNPNRSEALAKVASVPCLDDAISMIEKEHGVLPRLVVTSARPGETMLDYKTFKNLLPKIKEPVLILFGTAWGLDQSVLDRSDYRLNPIWGPGEYNHLSVRSAVAIILDRLFGH